MFFLSTQEKLYLKSKSISFKVLLFIILLKPLINSLWDVSLPFLNVTLLQFTSIIIVIILAIGLFKETLHKIPNLVNILFFLFTIFYASNILFVLINNLEFNTIKYLVKASVFPLSFFYAKKNINNYYDFILILNAFIKSIVPAIIIGIFDIFIVGSYQLTRGLERYDSSFGDIANIGLHINVVILIMNFHLLKSSKMNNQFKSRIDIAYLIFFIFSLIMLTKISHSSSFGVFVIINILFLIVRLKTDIFGLIFYVFFATIGISLALGGWIKTFYNNFLLKEVNALLNGEIFNNIENMTYLFHGRVGRWLRYIDEFSQVSSFKQYFGGYAIDYPYVFLHALHNDFLRIIMSTGYINFIIYGLFLFYLVISSLKIKDYSEKYLLLGIVFIIILYSITLTPTTYVDICIIFSTISLFILKKLYHEKNNPTIW
tara:strand:+ start:971 stop:2260 length:1290 start_codon:yes stop_codon:yes gene_type:complete